MKECISHHFACDCREADFKKLREENERLNEALQKIVAKSYSWIITMDTGPTLKPVHDMYRDIAREALETK